MEAAQTKRAENSVESRLDEMVSLLKRRNFDEVLLILKGLGNDELEECCWNFFPNVIEAANSFYSRERLPEYTQSSANFVLVNIMEFLLRTQTLKEGVVLCLSELQNAKSAMVFDILVEQIGRLLREQKLYSTDSFFWVIEGITTHLLSLATPEEPKYEDRSQLKLMDSTVEVLEIVDRYKPFCKFLKEQLDFMITEGHNRKIAAHTRLRSCVRLAAPLGRTLGLMDLTEPETEKEAASCHHVCAVRIAQIIERLHDPLPVLEFANDHSSETGKDRLSLDTKSAGVLAYIVFCLSRNFPRIYSPRVLAEKLLTFALHLLSSPRQMHVLKGIALVNESLAYVNLAFGDESQQLASLRILRALFDVMSSCTLEQGRKEALAAWKQLYKKFTPESQLQAIRALFVALENASVRGFLLDTLRAHLAEIKSTAPVQEIIQKLIFLPDDETTDLLHHSEYLLASLAMLRHLYLNRMLSGKIPELEIYLTKFKRALQLSRAHFELQLHNGENVDKELLASMIPNVPPDVEKNILAQGLTRFDLMESLLGLVLSAYDSSSKITAEH